MICENCGSNLPTKGMICPHCGYMLNKKQVDMQKSINEENRKKGTTIEYASDKYGIKKDYNLKKDNSYLKIYIAIIAFLIALTLILVIVR